MQLEVDEQNKKTLYMDKNSKISKMERTKKEKSNFWNQNL
jgi:hypothetical protein